jgi:beta-aspartyl-peptidase (threonine type)
MRALVLVVFAALLGCATTRPAAAPVHWGIAIHRGAGNIERGKLPPQKEAAYRVKLEEALRAGHDVLARGGSSVDAVVAALTVLEDSPLFNAGKGAVFTHDGRNELDSAIMDGAAHKAGAVAGVHRVKNPIQLARLVMDRSPHVMLIGEGAELFAQSQGVELVDPGYFYTPERWEQLQKALEEDRAKGITSRRGSETIEGGYKFGTVGAVALDQQGHLAAGTSTGGMTDKRYGRVGDSPIIGAGTYADEHCAISATGHGEFFIRYTVARDICARVEYQGKPLAEAGREVIDGELVKVGGEGGVISMDREGNVSMPFNTSGMFRGTYPAGGAPTVEIFATPKKP